MNRIAGLRNSDANRAFDMIMKTGYIRKLARGRGVVFATGTPISNTMAEMYTVPRYLAPVLLEERGVPHLDAWAANFAEAVTARLTFPPTSYACTRALRNSSTWLNLVRTGVGTGRPHMVSALAIKALKAYIKTLIERPRATLQPRGPCNPDGWQLTARDLISSRFYQGNSLNDYVEINFIIIEGQAIARAEVAPVKDYLSCSTREPPSYIGDKGTERPRFFTTKLKSSWPRERKDRYLRDSDPTLGFKPAKFVGERPLPCGRGLNHAACAGPREGPDGRKTEMLACQ